MDLHFGLSSFVLWLVILNTSYLGNGVRCLKARFARTVRCGVVKDREQIVVVVLVVVSISHSVTAIIGVLE